MTEEVSMAAVFAGAWGQNEGDAVDASFNPRAEGLMRPRTSPGTFHERTDLFVNTNASAADDYRTKPEYHAYYYSLVPRDPRLPMPLKPRHAQESPAKDKAKQSPSLTHQPYQPVTPEFLPKNLLNSPEVPSLSLPNAAAGVAFGGFSLMSDAAAADAERAQPPAPMLQLGSGVDMRFGQPQGQPQQQQQQAAMSGLKPIVILQQPQPAAPIITVGQRQAPLMMPITVSSGAAAQPVAAATTMVFNPYAQPQRTIPASTKPVPTTLHPYPQLDHSQGALRGKGLANQQHLGASQHQQQQPQQQQQQLQSGRGPTRAAASAQFQRPKSELLSEFLENPHKAWQLADIVGNIVDFSQDQDGSRLIQRFMEDGNTQNALVIFNEVRPVLRELVTDVFGNYVVQKLLECGIQEVRDEVVSSMRGEVLTLSLQTYGCRVVQKAFDHVDFHQQLSLAAELDGAVPQCVLNQNANHVIQKCIETMPDNCQFIINSFLGRVLDLSCHAYGCRVLQRVFEKCHNQGHLKELLDEVLRNTTTLVADQYGNYVVQHALINSPRYVQAEIIRMLTPHIKELACSKFASNVAEKIFEFAAPEELSNLFRLLLETDATGSSPLVCMMQDQFANYVVQRLIKVATPQQRQEIVEHITPRIPSIRRYTYGKHILARLEKMGLLPPSSGGGFENGGGVGHHHHQHQHHQQQHRGAHFGQHQHHGVQLAQQQQQHAAADIDMVPIGMSTGAAPLHQQPQFHQYHQQQLQLRQQYVQAAPPTSLLETRPAAGGFSVQSQHRGRIGAARGNGRGRSGVQN